MITSAVRNPSGLHKDRFPKVATWGSNAPAPATTKNYRTGFDNIQWGVNKPETDLKPMGLALPDPTSGLAMEGPTC